MQQSGLFYSHGLHRELPHVVILESVTDVSEGDDQRDGLWIDQSKKNKRRPNEWLTWRERYCVVQSSVDGSGENNKGMNIGGKHNGKDCKLKAR